MDPRFAVGGPQPISRTGATEEPQRKNSMVEQLPLLNLCDIMAFLDCSSKACGLTENPGKS